MNWNEVPLIAFDVETTGLNSQKDRVIQCAFVVRRPGLPNLNWVVLCGTDGAAMHPGAFAVHGIRVGQLAGLMPFDARLGAILDFLAPLVAEPHAFLAFNAPFDLSFLMAAFARKSGLLLPIDRAKVLDPLTVARSFWPKNSLGELAARLSVSRSGAHDALSDARTTIQVMLALAAEKQLPNDFDELLAFQEQCIVEWELRTKKKYWKV